MELVLCLRQVLMDHRTLKEYEQGHNVEWDTIRRRLLLLERTTNPVIPDQFYISAREHGFVKAGVADLASLLSKGLSYVSNQFITNHAAKGEICYIKNGLFEQWQNILTICPPMILIAAYLSKHIIVSDSDFLDDYIICNVKYTSLLGPYVKSIDEMKGFDDLHIHLNGSTETDVLWQFFLNNPDEIRQDLKKALKENMVREQIEQEYFINDSNHLGELLRKARALRYYIIREHFCSTSSKIAYPNSESEINFCYENTVKDIHPLQALCGIAKDRYNNNELECLMYVKIIQKLNNTDVSPLLAKAFHHYLLILGAVNCFVTQQKHQNGFRQFQKITKNKFRDGIEANFTQRFHQLDGNQRKNIGTLEGRISPKNAPLDIHECLQRIRAGWDKFTEGDKTKSLNLVFHFIKEPIHKYDSIRHQKLRTKLWHQSNAIASIINDELLFTSEGTRLINIVGIDAASSEFDAPPEVFGPAYRFLRRQGIRCFTFHAGEDFNHIISGLRAIFESVYFLDLKRTNGTEIGRIGHATALGVQPSLWLERIGHCIYMSVGEWLDNLLFCWLFGIRTENIKAEIKKYSIKVYGKQYETIELIRAWLYRKWEPDVILNNVSSSRFDEFEYKETPKVESEDVKELMRKYHDSSLVDTYNHINRIDTTVISAEDILFLQNKLINRLNKDEIVRETLPTSNLRIGIYKKYKEHHLIEWLKNLGSINLIVVGSDDTGIFSTSIPNEYLHIYESMELGDAIPFLINNAETHLFR